MKSVVLIISCLIPLLSLATSAQTNKTLELFQARCAKEKDPVKRQHYCHILDQNNQEQANTVALSRESMIA